MNTDTVLYVPRWKILLWTPVFFALAAALLWLFVSDSKEWWGGIQDRAPVVMFYPASGYLLGGSLFLFVIVAAAIVNLSASSSVTAFWRRAEKTLVITPVLITFLLPWLGNPMIESYLQKHGYAECPAMSAHDFRFSRIAYVRDSLTCADATNDRQQKQVRPPKHHAGAAAGRQIP